MANLQSKKKIIQKRLLEKFFKGGKKPPFESVKVLVMGLGSQGSGVGTANFFLWLGARVSITDIQTRKQLAAHIRKIRGAPTLRLGGHKAGDFKSADVVIKNPAVPLTSKFLAVARKSGAYITNDADIFLSLIPKEKIVGITGTKGKTTTAYLVAHILKIAGKKVKLIGVPETSYFDHFNNNIKYDYFVTELSSFDLDLVKSSPRYAVITSLFPDHLNRYKNFGDYKNAKLNIIKMQGKNDIAIIPSGSLGRYTKGKTVIFDNRTLKELWNVSPSSIGAAWTICKVLGIKQSVIKKALTIFKPLSGRLEIITGRKGAVFINDTASTNPGAAVYSLNLISKHAAKQTITVITGGDDKCFPKKEISSWAQSLKRSADQVVFLSGPFTSRLQKELGINEKTYNNFDQALRACGGDIIALIPAGASFNLFRNEFDRAKHFTDAIKKL